MDETIRLDDMRLVAELARARNFTDTARLLGMPKQSVSRRVADLERALGVRLVDRTTRSFTVTALGRVYADKCADIVRQADDVNRAMRGEATEVSGTLRVTADPLFGQRFLPLLVRAFARANPDVRVDVVLTSRMVDVVEEGFDVAFRVGAAPDPSLVATRIGPASVVFVAAKRYVERRGAPRTPADLAKHDLVALAPEGTSPRWAVRDGEGVRWIAIAPRVRVNDLALAREAALEGLGVANLPQFACGAEVARGALVRVLERHTAPFGAIYLVTPPRRLVTPRTRAFRELAIVELKKRSELAG
jgi:DNA-binding transcriptional LysR family regulator